VQAAGPKPEGSVKIDYVPYARTVDDYEEREEYEEVSNQVMTYETRKRLVKKPVERWVDEYIKIDRVTDYRLDYRTEQKTEMVQSRVIEYVPQEKKRYFYP
jgi:hypothetical protein